MGAVDIFNYIRSYIHSDLTAMARSRHRTPSQVANASGSTDVNSLILLHGAGGKIKSKNENMQRA